MAEEVPQRRRRNLLKEYYGIQSQENGGGEGEGEKAEVIDTTNINSPHFNANKHYEDLLRGNNLVHLIQIDNSMIAEIKKLDSDMKTLVYENYNKFISATETIRKMKSNVENMEEEMKRLSENMTTINTCSDHINGTLSVRREKIEQLSGVHRLLKKLQFLVELPARLRKSIELQAYGQAVKYFIKTENILKRYDNLPSFKQIYKDCSVIITDLRAKLKERIRSPVTPTPEVVEAVTLLLELKEPATSLREEFLKCRKKILEDKLTDYMSNQLKSVAVQLALFELNRTFLTDFLESSRCFRSHFIENENNPAERKIASAEADNFTKELFARYFGIVKTVVAESKEMMDMIVGLTILYDDLNKAHQTLPYLGINDKASSLINNTVQNQIETLFTALQNSVRDKIIKMGQTVNANSNLQNGSLTSICKSTAVAILADIKSLLDKLMFFLSSDAEFVNANGNTFMAKIHVMCEQFFLVLNIHVLENHDDEIRSSLSEINVSSRFILLLSRLCLILESEAITEVSNNLAKLRHIVDPKNTSPFNMNVSELQQRLKSTAERMLSYFIKLQSQKVSQMIWKGIDTNWMKVKEAKAPKPVNELILDEMKVMEVEIADVYDELTSKAIAEYHSNKGKPRRSENKNMFEKKVPLFNDVEFNKNSVMNDIARLSLKAWLEYARLKTFGKNGFQQMQIDIFFVQKALSNFVKLDNSISSLAAEILSNVSERCVEPTALEPGVIANFCEAKLSKYQVPVVAGPPTSNQTTS